MTAGAGAVTAALRQNRSASFAVAATPARATIPPSLSEPERAPVDANHEETDPAETPERRSAPGCPRDAAEARRLFVVEALPGAEFPAKLAAFSTLAKPDYSSWPPPRMFDATVDLDQPDPRLRPGMTSSIRVPSG